MIITTMEEQHQFIHRPQNEAPLDSGRAYPKLQARRGDNTSYPFVCQPLTTLTTPHASIGSFFVYNLISPITYPAYP